MRSGKISAVNWQKEKSFEWMDPFDAMWPKHWKVRSQSKSVGLSQGGWGERGSVDHLMKWEQPKKFWMSHFNSICSLINYHCSEYQLFVSVAQGTGLRRWQLSCLFFSKHCFQEKLGEYWMPYPIWRTLAEKIWCKSLDCAPLQCFNVASVGPLGPQGPQGPQRVQSNDGKIQKVSKINHQCF